MTQDPEAETTAHTRMDDGGGLARFLTTIGLGVVLVLCILGYHGYPVPDADTLLVIGICVFGAGFMAGA